MELLQNCYDGDMILTYPKFVIFGTKMTIVIDGNGFYQMGPVGFGKAGDRI